MIRVLVIDDEPERAKNLMPVSDLRIAHGLEQVKFWLRNTHWRPQVVFIDNDMPLMKGIDISRIFALDLVGIPTIVWSMNPVAAREIKASLSDNMIEGIHWMIRVKPFEKEKTPEQWEKTLSQIVKIQGEE